MEILVTGGVGRLGVKLAERLVEKGYSVRIFDLPFLDFSEVSGLKNIEIFRGDITNSDSVRKAVRGVDGIFHLAAILPPGSERDRERTMRVNVGGTENLLEAIKERRDVPVIIPSSVSVYGITAEEAPPIREDHHVVATDIYSESKIRCEELMKLRCASYTILRISGIAYVAFMELPDVLQFRADQRLEFIEGGDVVTALISSLEREEARNKVFNIAGGKTWQLRGEEYITRLCEALDIPSSGANYSKDYGFFDWYDTSRSRRVLNYQHTTFEEFLNKIRALMMEEMEE